MSLDRCRTEKTLASERTHAELEKHLSPSHTCTLGRELSRCLPCCHPLMPIASVMNALVCFEGSGRRNCGKHAPNYCVPHFRKKEITNVSVCKTTSSEKKSEKVTNLATVGFWCAFTLHMLCFLMSAVLPWHLQSAGQEWVFRNRGWGGGLLMISRSFSSPDLREKAPERGDRYVSQTRCHPPASLRTLVAVKTRKEKSKQETDEAEKHEIKNCWKIWHLRMRWHVR